MNDKVTGLAEILLDVLPKLAVFAGTPWLKLAYTVAEIAMNFPEFLSFINDNAQDREKTLAKMENVILAAAKIHQPTLLQDNQSQTS